MVTIVDDLETVTLQEAIFKDVKYYLSGDVSERIMRLLLSGGAENTKYLSDYVTHLICGQNPSENDIDEAQDIYQIPAVTEHWILACARLKKLANPKPYSPNKSKIFLNVVACVTKVSAADAKSLFAVITYYGGRVKLNLDSQCTHLICGVASGKKYSIALSFPPSRLKIVTPDWVLESIRARIQAATDIFHPKLLIVPQPPPKPMDRISAITGFDFEEGIAKNEVPTQNMAESKDDSTQALLDKLKQRMPWNHPPSSAPSSHVVTSAINTMGYTSTSVPTSSIMTKTLPQGIVTQNMQNVQIQNSQANTQMIQKFGQNTVVSQPSMMQNQQVNLQYNQSQQQQQQQQQPHGLTAIQMQQQKMLQQHQLKMQMIQQQNKINQQNQQQGMNNQFSQPNVSVSQMTQNMSGQLQQHIQSSQHHMQQSIQSPTTSMSSAQQQIENISQMLSQSANNLQQQQLNQQNMAMKQGLSLSQQTASQAVQNIAQQLAQSTQQIIQNAKMNQNLGQPQVINQQIISSGQQLNSQNQGLIQQQTVQSMTNQQQNMNMVSQGIVSSTQGQSGQQVQLNQLVNQQGQLVNQQGQQIQSVQQTIQTQQTTQGAWRQQNVQMVQNVQGQHQIIRGPLVQRNQQNQVILQQQIIQTQQQALINNQQPQLSPQHTIQSPQILQQSINSQGQAIGQAHHQILVQKQQLLNSSGQQQIVQAPQQVLINQHTGQQQILVHGNQQVTLQQGQQLVSQSQIVHQGGQIVNQGGQQIITQGTQQVLSQGGQHVIQQGQQHQVVIAQSSQQIVTQSGQQIIGQTVGQTQQILSQLPQSPQAGGQLTAGGGIQQIITHAGGQQIVSPGGQQLVQGQNVSWQQQQYLQQRQQIAQPGTVGPRVSWTAGGGGRQLIHLDARTHEQLQQMNPKQRAMFVAQLQKRRQLSLQRAAALAHQQQPGGVVASPGAQSPAPQSVTFIRSQIAPEMGQQQQVQWLQSPGARATIPIASPAPPQSPGGTAVASPVTPTGGSVEQMQQLAFQRQQQIQRIQQLQAQRELAQHHHAVKQVPVSPGVTQQVLVPEGQGDQPLLQPTTPEQHQANNALLVNPKTKTALANMLSIRLQGTAPPTEHEPSAAGTLRLMTAAHAAGGAVRAPARLLLGPAHHPHQAATPGVGVVGNKVYAGAVRAPPARAQFYGHNPNLKLPPDLFLLGCVFHIVEYQQTWGTERVARWSEAIQRRGGEVEAGYCARVTHVLAETQKHGVVMQALRDAKRCVTAYWLSDAMVRRAVAPPWQALHLPTMYSSRDRPAKHHRAAISGWRSAERERVSACIAHIGAKLTPYMTRDNTVLICKRAEGNKYRRAREWGVPVVTAAWLTDLLLGNMSALAQIENAKYQQFSLASPFRMDYSLVSHLMNAWKMAINITQESHERAKRSAAALASNPRRAKRPRLESPVAAPLTAVVPPPLHLAPRVLFSAVTPQLQNKLSTYIRQLGGLVVTSPIEATHLVMEKLVRTSKLVSCLVTVKHLLTPEWVYESQRHNKFADEAMHELKDAAFNKMFKCDVSEVLLCGEQRRRLFEGVTFFLTPCVKPARNALVEMIELCGGKVEKNRRSYVSIQEMHAQRPYCYLVLTVPNDLHLVYYLLQADKTLNVVCSTEVVLSAIMRQKLEVQDFLIKID